MGTNQKIVLETIKYLYEECEYDSVYADNIAVDCSISFAEVEKALEELKSEGAIQLDSAGCITYCIL